MNTLKKMSMVVATIFAMNVASAQDVQISFSELPASAQSFIKTHYPQEKVAYILKDMEHNRVEDYEVILGNRAKIEFYANGDWKEIKSKTAPIPTNIVPTKISQYLTQNYPNASLKEIKKKQYGYEVELVGGLDLKFNTNGDFLGVDD